MTKVSRRQTVASILAAGASAAVPSTLAARPGGASVRVSFLLVNDIYRIEEKDGRGGMARFAAAVKAERARALVEDCRLICVHAGDTLSPSLLSSFDQGAHMIDLFNDVGLDAFVPGNHEFDFGKEVYFNRVIQARFPILGRQSQERRRVDAATSSGSNRDRGERPEARTHWCGL
jgi:5'-nucleotidase / UDP-sugar diphosphatase